MCLYCRIGDTENCAKPMLRARPINAYSIMPIAFIEICFLYASIHSPCHFHMTNKTNLSRCMND